MARRKTLSRLDYLKEKAKIGEVNGAQVVEMNLLHKEYMHELIHAPKRKTVYGKAKHLIPR